MRRYPLGKSIQDRRNSKYRNSRVRIRKKALWLKQTKQREKRHKRKWEKQTEAA